MYASGQRFKISGLVAARMIFGLYVDHHVSCLKLFTSLSWLDEDYTARRAINGTGARLRESGHKSPENV